VRNYRRSPLRSNNSRPRGNGADPCVVSFASDSRVDAPLPTTTPPPGQPSRCRCSSRHYGSGGGAQQSCPHVLLLPPPHLLLPTPIFSRSVLAPAGSLPLTSSRIRACGGQIYGVGTAKRLRDDPGCCFRYGGGDSDVCCCRRGCSHAATGAAAGCCLPCPDDTDGPSTLQPLPPPAMVVLWPAVARSWCPGFDPAPLHQIGWPLDRIW
jgi:hypothetical protein